ncbi:hypothetical protein ACFL4L_01850 [bacterium]
MIYFKDIKSHFTRVNLAQGAVLGVDNPESASRKTNFDFFTNNVAQATFDDEKKIMQTSLP